MLDKRPFRTTRTLANLRQGRNDWYQIRASSAGAPTELRIYDEIGFFGITAQDLIKDLDAAGPGDLDVHIHCPGGDVFEGLAIYNALSQRNGTVRVVVDSLAASAASFIAQAASPGQLSVAKTASVMIHDAFGLGIGNSKDLRELADLLDQQSDNIAGIYAGRSGKPVGEWRAAMRAESWYVGQAAVDAGLADRVQDGKGNPKNDWDLSIFPRYPGPGISNADKYSADDRKRMAANGHAMPDGSYPIEDEEDLGNAIRAVGRGGSDHDAIRRHIIKRASALGLSSRIPDNWNPDGSISTSDSADTSWLIDALKGATE